MNDALALSDRSISVALDGQRPSVNDSNARVLKGSILGLTFCFLYNRSLRQYDLRACNEYR